MVGWDGTIKKLPPGKAEGADDLQGWGRRRAAGRSGVKGEKRKPLRCTRCNATEKEIELPQRCMACGGPMVRQP
jgi:hypothetical protein